MPLAAPVTTATLSWSVIASVLVWGLWSGVPWPCRRALPARRVGAGAEIVGFDRLRPGRAAQHLGMLQRPAHILVAGAPVVLHRLPGELVVLRVALVGRRAVDQVADVVDARIGGGGEQLRLGRRREFRRH